MEITGDMFNMEGKKKNAEIDWDALDEHWAEQYEEEFGHFFIISTK